MMGASRAGRAPRPSTLIQPTTGFFFRRLPSVGLIGVEGRFSSLSAGGGADLGAGGAAGRGGGRGRGDPDDWGSTETACLKD